MLALPFTVNALSLKGIAEDVLIIGLGGGNLDMSLHHYMPMVRPNLRNFKIISHHFSLVFRMVVIFVE